ncbi:nuclease-related domain-containing protein [Kingella denitrificans]|uniref:nuclease-related domain-containing protein n=1 Tax=Kingella denitrificans TaxID=502 RepID=UPI0028D4E1CD|nr:nuclease-related domain-containing protein [Kingella denitrificans]
MEKLAYALVFIALMFAVLNILTNQDKDEPPPRTARRKKPRPVEPHPTEPPAETANTSSKSLAEKKGDVGEQIVKVAVLSKLDAAQYRHFSNLIIPAPNGTTQIDNIVVSPFGVFVIEAKYFQGWIFGGAKQEKWTHTLSRFEKYAFPNPIRQNYGHIKALARLLRQPESRFHSVIVFAHRNCQLKTELPANVCLQHNFIEYIQGFTKNIVDDAALARIYAVLQQPEWQATEDKKAAHVERLKAAQRLN